MQVKYFLYTAKNPFGTSGFGNLEFKFAGHFESEEDAKLEASRAFPGGTIYKIDKIYFS